MHWLNGTYAGWFNRHYKRSGHLFQGRFKSFLVEKETYLREVLRYVVLNPVRARMVASPQQYEWSSYRATAGLASAEPWLDMSSIHVLFDPDPEAARSIYQDFVTAKVTSSERLWDQVINGLYLGSGSWAKRMRAMVESKPRSTDHPKTQRTIGRPRMFQIVRAVARVADSTADALRTMRGGPLRRLIAWLGWNEGLVTLRSIAASLLLRSEGHVSGMIRRCEKEFADDPVLVAQLDLATAALRG